MQILEKTSDNLHFYQNIVLPYVSLTVKQVREAIPPGIKI